MLVSFPISADALKMLFIKSYSSLGLFCIVLYIDIYIALLIHSFIHSGHFYSVPSSPLLLRGAPTTARILYQSFTPKPTGNCRLPKVPTWRLERESNPRPSG